MSEQNFQVVFSGRITEGAELAQVKANVAGLFKVGVDKVEQLFTGQPVVIKKGLDEATANKYQLALQRAGAICQVVDLKAAAVTPQTAAATPPASVSNPPGEKEDTIPTIDSGLHKSVVKPAPIGLGELDGVKLDEPGVILVHPEAIPEPHLDLSGLSMDEPGVVLTVPEEVVEPRLDLSGLSLDEPGVVLVAPQVVPALEVNLEGLSLDEPGVTLVEHVEPEKPSIDTSKLSLD